MAKKEQIKDLCFRGFTLDYILRNVNGSESYIKIVFNDYKIANWKDGFPKFYAREMEYENEMEYGTPDPVYNVQDLVGDELKIYLKLKDNEAKKKS